jgi:hypothetical protein
MPLICVLAFPRTGTTHLLANVLGNFADPTVENLAEVATLHNTAYDPLRASCVARLAAADPNGGWTLAKFRQAGGRNVARGLSTLFAGDDQPWAAFKLFMGPAFCAEHVLAALDPRVRFIVLSRNVVDTLQSVRVANILDAWTDVNTHRISQQLGAPATCELARYLDTVVARTRAITSLVPADALVLYLAYEDIHEHAAEVHKARAVMALVNRRFGTRFTLRACPVFRVVQQNTPPPAVKPAGPAPTA